MGVLEQYRLDGQVAVITGGGRGLGEGIAHALSDAGAAVVVAARRAAEVEKVAADINAKGGRAIAVPTDVTNSQALEALAQAAVDNFGKLTILVNNAGGSRAMGPLTELSAKDWQDCVDLNITAVWAATVAAVKRMTEGGAIVNISSLVARGPIPGSGHYGAAKAAVNSLTETFARELAPNIRVNAIMPGYIPTEVMMAALGVADESGLPALAKQLAIPMGTFGKPQDIGAAVVYLCSPASGWVTGQMLPVTGGH
ncbi:glucose 1-dehydrogenase [Emcibacter sp. SYSU 3D8]|uniref:SDR family NAD(P)-dependent oxidoreductase n=1 Tax=Emcibacter sp. SYSU 3D8 TaxID=3133969 RepID=UPI0031FF14CD